jgi:putative membrane protein
MNAPARRDARPETTTTDRRDDASIRHYQHAEYLANERTHLAYLRTAVALISLGITMNRVSQYFLISEQLERSRPLALLRNTAQLGLGMVLYGFGLMVLALHRYLRVEREIDQFDYQPQRRFVKGLTLGTLFAAGLSMIWLFLR